MLLKALPAFSSVEIADSLHGLGGARYIANKESIYSIFDDFRN